MKVRGIVGWLAAWWAAIGLAVVAGCGGGVGSGGTGMSAGVAQGTVNGFGSVIVDGERFDDSQVATFTETEPGVQTQTTARLGERVEVEYEGGVAKRLNVDAALVGGVDAMNAPGGFTILGQVVGVNADARRGPVTQFGGGYTGLASLQPADAVEVHGFVVRGTDGSYTIQATRVERLAAAPRYLRLTGLVGVVDGAGFQLGAMRVEARTAAVLPAGRSLAEGQRVSVLAPADSLAGAPGAAPHVRAAQVRIRVLGEPGAEVQLSGVVARFDAPGRRFDLGGTAVDYAGAAVRPDAPALADGRYVQLSGTLQPDGSVLAATVRVRDGSGEAEAELKGNVDGYDPLTLRFSVRGVAVDASGAEVGGCPGGTLAEGLFVELEGALGPTGVIAKKVECEDEPGDATVERKGTAGAADLAASSFVLTPGSGEPVTVRWSDITYFEKVDLATLAGQRVKVEGRLVDGVLVAKKVERDD